MWRHVVTGNTDPANGLDSPQTFDGIVKLKDKPLAAQLAVRQDIYARIELVADTNRQGVFKQLLDIALAQLSPSQHLAGADQPARGGVATHTHCRQNREHRL